MHGEERNHPKPEIYYMYIKIKVIALIINFRRNKSICNIERCKSLKRDSVSVVLALFNRINLIDLAFKIRVVNVQKVIEVLGSRIKSLDNISLIFMHKEIHAISFVAV